MNYHKFSVLEQAWVGMWVGNIIADVIAQKYVKTNEKRKEDSDRKYEGKWQWLL